MAISISTETNYLVTLDQPTSFSITQTETIVANNFADLQDVDTSGASNNYLIAYNSATGKYVAVNPDTILTAAVVDSPQVGLPTTFLNELDVQLDDKIDLDAGTF